MGITRKNSYLTGNSESYTTLLVTRFHRLHSLDRMRHVIHQLDLSVEKGEKDDSKRWNRFLNKSTDHKCQFIFTYEPKYPDTVEWDW